MRRDVENQPHLSEKRKQNIFRVALDSGIGTSSVELLHEFPISANATSCVGARTSEPASVQIPAVRRNQRFTAWVKCAGDNREIASALPSLVLAGLVGANSRCGHMWDIQLAGSPFCGERAEAQTRSRPGL
jgi:hypothetical protein